MVSLLCYACRIGFSLTLVKQQTQNERNHSNLEGFKDGPDGAGESTDRHVA
jgi:hypothetical protein